jgi:alkanesulfonate monooxygenase SsuD/methylene tetrahydromethanopterin reductase-like flavin-dependent oxidoreductase (luciferase family)
VSIVDKLKFYYFHHHHYLDVPADRDQHPATWVVYPNRLFDPEKGHKYYERHLRTVILAETLGFDGITINEHHNTTYSMTPTVSLMGAAIATNTSRARILVAGVPVNLRSVPAWSTGRTRARSIPSPREHDSASRSR